MSIKSLSISLTSNLKKKRQQLLAEASHSKQELQNSFQNFVVSLVTCRPRAGDAK
jgi:hypothetical protein